MPRDEAAPPSVGASEPPFAWRRRRSGDAVAAAFVWSAVALVVAAFVAIVGDLVARGARHVTWSFLTELPAQAGRAGGIASVLVGTLAILLVALGAALPVGIACAIYLVEFTRGDRGAGRFVRRSLDVLSGVPSIVFGLFGMALFSEFLGLGWSIASGGLTLGCMVLPLLIRATEQSLAAVPAEQRAAAAAVGLSRTGTLRHVVLPQAAHGIGVGLVLSIGRVLAESAALMFTAGAAVRMPSGPLDSSRSLAYHVYVLAIEVPGGQPRAYSAALVLVVLLLVINVGARYALAFATRRGRSGL